MQSTELDRLLMKPTKQRSLGRYVLLGKIGHGGMGKIYLAFQPGPGGIERLVVIKRLHSHLRKDEKLVANFLDEARLSMSLNHPNVVHTYDIGEEHDRTFMVLEFIDGQNLGVFLRTAKRNGTYPDAPFWSFIMMGVLDGLFHAHNVADARGRSLQIIHRDISPQNILVGYDGVPKLVDFGIAKASMRLSETDVGVLKGKYAYMSPEQVKGEPLEHRSDLFAAGVVLWECFAGRRLYKCDSIVQSAKRIVGEPPISPLKVSPDCDPALAKIVVKALQKKPKDRFQTAEDFRDALDEALRAAGHPQKRRETRELLASLFGDLRDKQQRLLDRCLDLASDDRSMTPAPSDEPLMYDEESGSDFKVPALKLQEHVDTTHSALAIPILVTREEEPSNLPETKEERTKPVGNADEVGAAPVKNENHTGGFSSLLVEYEEPDESRSTPATSSSAPPVATKKTLSNASPSEKKKKLPLAAMASLLFVVVWAVVFGVLPFAEKLEAPSGLGVHQEDGAPKSAQKVGEKPPLVEEKNKTPQETTVFSKPQHTTSTTTPVAPDLKSVLPPQKKKTVSIKGPKKRPRAVPKEVWKKPKRSKQYLTLDTVPWTDVYLNGKHLGTTPVVKLSVPAGRIRLLLVNKKEGIEKRYEVNIPKGESVRKRLGLK
ncbi:MAG: protein kinase [Deltaproteobacteria bacterium]|nr:protein kinase [Deltaproteobacteria bacterium]